MIKAIFNIFKNLFFKKNTTDITNEWLSNAEQNIANLEAKVKEIENQKYIIKPPIKDANSYATNMMQITQSSISSKDKAVLKNFRLLASKY